MTLRTRLALAAATATLAVAAPGALAKQRGANAPVGGSVTLFKDPNFSGPAIVIDGPVGHLNDIRFNDVASSAQVDGVWEFCADPNFTGRCEVVDFDVLRLSGIGLNDTITSLRPVAESEIYRDEPRRGRGGSGRGPALEIYEGLAFTGETVALNRGFDDLSAIGFNDRILSIRVNRGEWLLCEDKNLTGDCEVIDADIRDVGRIDLNRRITSLARYTGQPYGEPVFESAGPGYGGGYGNPNAGYGSGYNTPSAVEGVTTVFFPQPEVNGRPIQARYGADDQFCRGVGLDRAAFSEQRNGQLVDVLCEK